MSKKHILIVASSSNSLINFRGDFISSLIDKGYKVYTAAGDYNETILENLKTLGAVPLTYSIQRTGLNPIKDLRTIKDLKTIIKDNKIDLVIPYTIKPVIYSSIAANSTDVKVISLITGLGFTFSGLTFKSKILQKLNEFLYKKYVSKNKAIVFQNKDDYKLFIDRKIITKDNRIAIVSGSGVNLDRFKHKNYLKKDNYPVSFLFVARLIREKGIGLYIDAAKTLKKKYPNAEFHVLGAAQNSPSAIKLEELNMLNEKEILVYHGRQSNVGEHLTNRDIFVLPSYYREGIPRSILEALSVGLPIITTDSPGCRETIINNENGILIKPQNLNELINAMEYFIINTQKIEEMGTKSREYAKKRFDVNIINSDLNKLITEII